PRRCEGACPRQPRKEAAARQTLLILLHGFLPVFFPWFLGGDCEGRPARHGSRRAGGRPLSASRSARAPRRFFAVRACSVLSRACRLASTVQPPIRRV